MCNIVNALVPVNYVPEDGWHGHVLLNIYCIRIFKSEMKLCSSSNKDEPAMTGQRSARLTHRGCPSKSRQCGAAPSCLQSLSLMGESLRTSVPTAQAALHRTSYPQETRKPLVMAPSIPPGCTRARLPALSFCAPAHRNLHLCAYPRAVPWSRPLHGQRVAQFQGLMATCQS